MTEPARRLYRSRTDARIAGLCGGLGAYFGVDPVVIRLVWVVVTAFTGFVPGILAYVLGWIVVPLEPTPESAQAAPVSGGEAPQRG